MKKKILVTGAEGFIASHLVEALLKKNFHATLEKNQSLILSCSTVMSKIGNTNMFVWKINSKKVNNRSTY